MLPMLTTSSGTVRMDPTQSRLIRSADSACESSSPEGIIGSSIIPHLGQAPGWSCTTSGSIGQMYFAPGISVGGGLGLPDR